MSDAKEMRQEITILPAEAPRQLNWLMFDSEEGFQRHILEKSGREGLDAYLWRNHPDRRAETDWADAYRHSQGIKPAKDTPMNGGGCRPLRHLHGRAWDNDALNEVLALSPSKIRVAGYGKSVTCDYMKGRVTVWLGEDDRTIRDICMESSRGAIGHGCCEDVSANPHRTVAAFINEEAIKLINAGEEGQ